MAFCFICPNRQPAGAQQVARIALRVGVLSGVDAEARQFALEAILPGTAADGAVIEIAAVADIICECLVCGRPSTDIKQGRELELTRLEIF